MEKREVVLITGCSSGIGAALAEEFHRRGRLVYATARRTEALAGLAAQGIRTLALDVNDPASVAAAIATVGAEAGRVDVLVNNAGFGLFGAVVDMSGDDLRRQFETNVFAPMALIRAALPLLRAPGRSVVVNVGSVSGIMTTPFAGVYCASKAALHALSDALRMELAPFGIRIVTLQPGAIASRFGDNGTANVVLPDDSIYQPVAKAVRARAKASQKDATPAEELARRLADAIALDSPPAELRVGNKSFTMPAMKRWLSTARLDRVLSKRFGLGRLGGG